MQNILMKRDFVSMHVMMYWRSGWYVVKSDEGILKKKNENLYGVPNLIRPANVGK